MMTMMNTMMTTMMLMTKLSWERRAGDDGSRWRRAGAQSQTATNLPPLPPLLIIRLFCNPKQMYFLLRYTGLEALCRNSRNPPSQSPSHGNVPSNLPFRYFDFISWHSKQIERQWYCLKMPNIKLPPTCPSCLLFSDYISHHFHSQTVFLDTVFTVCLDTGNK